MRRNIMPFKQLPQSLKHELTKNQLVYKNIC